MIRNETIINKCTPNVQLIVLDVGHGNAALLHEDQTTVLMDAASGAHVLEYLRRKNISELDLVILSHSDSDHIGGLIGLLDNGIRIKSVRVNADADKTSEAWRDLVFSLGDARRRGELQFEVGLSTGIISIPNFRRCQLEIIAPTPELAALGSGALDRRGRKITSNSISAGIRINVEGHPFAFLSGDMDEIALDEIMDAKAEIGAAILIFPHHGGLPGSSNAIQFAEKFLDQVKPKTVIFSHGRNMHNNPRPEIVSAVRKCGAAIACTQLSKSCSKSVITEHGYLPNIYSAGSKSGMCCAGSLAISFNSTEASYTSREAHQSFITEKVNSPLCRI